MALLQVGTTILIPLLSYLKRGLTKQLKPLAKQQSNSASRAPLARVHTVPLILNDDSNHNTRDLPRMKKKHTELCMLNDCN
jgi:hypothetical protein